MKILFIYPPKNNKALAPSNLEPLALEILAATIPSHDMELLDLRFESFPKLERKLSQFKPEITAISVNDTIQVYQAKAVLKSIKEIDPRIINIVGGHHPTLTCDDFFEKYVDAIFLGWAEKSFPAYISFLQSKRPIDSLPGIILLENGNIIYQNRKIEKLKANDIPKPNRQIVAKYRNHYKNEIGQKFVLVNTARGCPHRCTFCACWKAANGQYLVRNAADVFNELRDIPRDIERIFFADDNTFSDVKRAEELYHLIKSGNIKKKYTGYCRSDIIVKNPKIFARWKEIGLENLTIGFESIDNLKLQEYGKKIVWKLMREPFKS
jgi:radical SAM superfamily enzyme YgiQ (UPF0313 family)